MLIDAIQPAQSSEVLPRFMENVALVVEAAGCVTRAVRVGMLHPEGSDGLEALKWMIPVSRGGFDSHPDADDIWTHVLEAAIEKFGAAALNRMQHEIETMENTGQVWRGDLIPDFDA